MPQTRFVTKKALALGLKPIVVINKIDKPSARPSWVIDQTFELFDNLGATDEQLDFPIVYASGLSGFAKLEETDESNDMRPLFDTILKHTPAPSGSADETLQLQISQLDYDNYTGRLGIGRILNGRIKPGQVVAVMNHEEQVAQGRINQLLGFQGLERVPLEEAEAGDIVIISGIEDIGIGVTITDKDNPKGLPMLSVDEPTLTMNFMVNTSPLAGREKNTKVTARMVKDRLDRELIGNVSLRVLPTSRPDAWEVQGRGELALAILVEQMRREGFELTVGKPQVVTKEIDGKRHEPVERMTIDVPEEYLGAVTQLMAARKGRMETMTNHGTGWIRMEFLVPSRGLIGFRTEFLTETRGTGIAHSTSEGYEPWAGTITTRVAGSLVADRTGPVTSYAMVNLQERGTLFVEPGTEVYEGMIVGENSRADDMDVNITKEKKLTNVRASSADNFEKVIPPRQLSLEQSLEFCREDECCEVTPTAVRIRKVVLNAGERARTASRVRNANKS